MRSTTEAEGVRVIPKGTRWGCRDAGSKKQNFRQVGEKRSRDQLYHMMAALNRSVLYS